MNKINKNRDSKKGSDLSFVEKILTMFIGATKTAMD